MIPEEPEDTGRADPPGRSSAEQGTAYTAPPSDVPARAAARYVPPEAEAVLLVRRGPGAGRRHPLAPERATSLGRAADCDIVLDHPTVSRHHAAIHREHGRFVLTDTGSLNGTYLNRSPAIAAVLADGDDIAVGVFRLTLQIRAAATS